MGVGFVASTKNPQGLIRNDDETVRRWAVDAFETDRDETEPISDLWLEPRLAARKVTLGGVD